MGGIFGWNIEFGGLFVVEVSMYWGSFLGGRILAGSGVLQQDEI